MNLKQLINKSVYGTIGYISSQDDIDLLEQYILYNLHILKEFKQIVVATNYGASNWYDLQKQRKINFVLWRKHFPNCVLIDSKINRGHHIGTSDLDDMIFDWCKENHIEWLCKSANDIIIQENIFNKEIEEADFYYLNGIGYAGAKLYDFDPKRIIDEYLIDHFYPQTNFYFINISKTDYLNNKKHVTEVYENLQQYGGTVWDHGFKSCEFLLRECIERNNLSKYHLITKENFIILLNTILKFNIHDGSHKNIMIENICHFHFNNEPVIEI
jgi:hypothetical protein